MSYRVYESDGKGVILIFILYLQINQQGSDITSVSLVMFHPLCIHCRHVHQFIRALKEKSPKGVANGKINVATKMVCIHLLKTFVPM